MAEYNDVIKQFKRMCRYTNHSGLPNECPLYCKGHGCNISHCRLLAFEDKKFQNVVMSWAADHPEPVYPTWGDYLLSIGVVKIIPDGIPAELPNGDIVEPPKSFYVDLNANIRSDIAQKLGLQPKER